MLTAWILAGKLDSLALIIMNRDTREVVERWQFDIQVEEPPPESSSKEKQYVVSAQLGILELQLNGHCSRQSE